jgi:hypothetical protein
VENLKLMPGQKPKIQKLMSDKVFAGVYSNLFDLASSRQKARLRSQSSKFAGSWIQCIPLKLQNLSVKDAEFRTMLAWWIGVKLFKSVSPKCICGQRIDAFGDHC